MLRLLVVGRSPNSVGYIMKRLAYFLLALTSVTLPALAADETFSSLINARSLRCAFGPGASADWETGKPVVKSDKFEVVLQFDGIDLKDGKARMIGNQGASDVVVILTPRGITFLERTESGNLSVTTVFTDYARGTHDFVVVHSRHIGGLGSPLPSQYHGTCKVWE